MRSKLFWAVVLTAPVFGAIVGVASWEPPPADAAEAWNRKAHEMAARRAIEEPTVEPGERAVAREKLRIYNNCMQSDKPIKWCAEQAGFWP